MMGVRGLGVGWGGGGVREKLFAHGSLVFCEVAFFPFRHPLC